MSMGSVGKTLSYSIYCHTCGSRTLILVDSAEAKGGNYDVIPCSHCGQSYVIHWHPQYMKPKIYKLAATRSFLTKIREEENDVVQKKEGYNGDSTNTETDS